MSRVFTTDIDLFASTLVESTSRIVEAIEGGHKRQPSKRLRELVFLISEKRRGHEYADGLTTAEHVQAIEMKLLEIAEELEQGGL